MQRQTTTGWVAAGYALNGLHVTRQAIDAYRYGNPATVRHMAQEFEDFLNDRDERSDNRPATIPVP